MLAFVLWPLWNQLKGPLKSVLNEKFSLVGGQLKALLSSTIDDLIAALEKEFFHTDVWRHEADRTVSEKSGKKKTFGFTAFPTFAIDKGSKIKIALIDRLKANVRLDAVRTDAGITDQDWHALLENYAADILSYGLTFALKRMIENETPPLYSPKYVVALADKEPIKIAGVAGHHDLVILYSKSTLKGAPTLSDANKVWKKRNDSAYNYELGDFDGFVAV